MEEEQYKVDKEEETEDQRTERLYKESDLPDTDDYTNDIIDKLNVQMTPWVKASFRILEYLGAKTILDKLKSRHYFIGMFSKHKEYQLIIMDAYRSKTTQLFKWAKPRAILSLDEIEFIQANDILERSRKALQIEKSEQIRLAQLSRKRNRNK